MASAIKVNGVNHTADVDGHTYCYGWLATCSA